MPGALTGLDQAGTKVVLGSFGMVAVELQGDGGELLQIASGKTVELRLAVSALQLSKAPATIPMWYFDEVKGYWVEEGQAVLKEIAMWPNCPIFPFGIVMNPLPCWSVGRQGLSMRMDELHKMSPYV